MRRARAVYGLQRLYFGAPQWIRTTDLRSGGRRSIQGLLLAVSVAMRPVVLAPSALRAPGILNAGRGASKTSRRARRRVRRPPECPSHEPARGRSPAAAWSPKSGKV